MHKGASGLLNSSAANMHFLMLPFLDPNWQRLNAVSFLQLWQTVRQKPPFRHNRFSTRDAGQKPLETIGKIPRQRPGFGTYRAQRGGFPRLFGVF
jgi:hypothetical protein